MSDILITDDERDIRELISDILKDEGFTTVISLRRESEEGANIEESRAAAEAATRATNMRSSGSSVVTRRYSSLAARSPGTVMP